MHHAWGSVMDHPDMRRCPISALVPGDLFTVPMTGVLWMKLSPGLSRQSDGHAIVCVQVGGRHGNPGTLDSWRIPGDVIALGRVSTYLDAVLDDDEG